MLDRLNYLQENLIYESHSLLEVFSTGPKAALGLSWGGVVITMPYVALMLVDVGLYVMVFALMFEYSQKSKSLGALELGRAVNKLATRLAMPLLAVCVVTSALVFNDGSVFPIYFFGGLYSISLASQVWKVIVIGVWVVWSAYFTKHYPIHLAETIILAAFALSFGVSAISANHFVLLFLILEGLSLTSYVMAAAARQHGNVTGAAQYFIYGSLGSILLLLGVVFLYGGFRVMSLSVWSTLLQQGAVTLATQQELWHLYVASALIVGGLLIKFGAAPFHGWVVEVYTSLPYHVMWFFSAFTKLILGLVLFRVLASTLVFGVVELTGVLSLIVGCLGALRQSEVKGLFAYGSVMHVGFMVLASPLAFQVYLLAYISSVLLIGLAVTSLRLNGQEAVYLSDVAHATSISSAPTVAALIIGLLSMGGVPPLAGFWGKFEVMVALIAGSESSASWSALIIALMLIVILVAFFYYFRLVTWICLSLGPSSRYAINTGSSLVTILLSLSALLVGFGAGLWLVQDLLHHPL